MKDKLRIKLILEKEKIRITKIEKLAGDASDRKFYRISTSSKNYIVLLYPNPINKELNLFKVYQLFKASSLPISKILDIWFDEGVILLQDLGNESLQRYVKTNNAEKVRRTYYQAISLIQKIQKEGGKNLDSYPLAYHYELDKEKLLWELNFFIENYLQNFLGKKISRKEHKMYNDVFKKLLDLIDWQQMVLCHRDYHSRNLFIVKDKIYMVDYQDTTLGPPLYDLASLLYDSYVQLRIRLKNDLIQYAYNSNNYGWSQEKFKTQLLLTSLQRNIKALGTFGFQVAIKKRKRYLAYIPRTLNYVNQNINFFPELALLKSLIRKWIIKNDKHY